MSKKKVKYKTLEIRVPGIPSQLHDELKNIAAHSGVTIAQLLRPVLRDFANTKPENIRHSPPKD